MPAGFSTWMLGPDGSSAPVFSPTSIPGLTLWVNARTGVISSGGSVSQWSDQSGQGNNYIQSSGSNQPTLGTINGFTALSFANGSLQNLRANTSTDIVSANAFTIFAVWQWNTARTTPTYNSSDTNITMPAILTIGNGSSDGNAIGAAVDATLNTNVDTYTGVSLASFSVTSADAVGAIANPHQSYHAFNGSNVYASIDGGTVVSTAASGSLSVLVGTEIGAGEASTTQFWDGTIGEILVYNTFLTNTQISQIQNFLNTEWGL